MNRFLQGMVRAVVETFDLPGPVLEIGSYQVPGQEEYSDLRALFAGRPYLGVDARLGPGVDFVADVEALPQPDASVGTVLAMNTFEHVPRFWRGFEEIYRVLRPDGVLLVSCPFYFHIHGYPRDYWRFTPEALDLLLQGYPSKIMGRHGPARRPASVWALAFREDRPPITPAQFERYRHLMHRYARQPLPWARKWRYRLGRWLCGQRPFAPYLERERWETELRGARGEGPEARGEGPEARGQKPGARGQKPGARGQKPGARGQKPGARGECCRVTSSTRLPPVAPRPSREGIDISVCIVNWNCRDLLRACLGSLQDQQGVRLEIIVVDNASADGAADMVACEFPEVVLQRNSSNLGFARANNRAAALARGRYLFFLNNDTHVPPGTLRRLLDYAEAHPEVGMLGPGLRDGQGRLQVSYRLRPTLATLLHRTSLLRWTGLLRNGYHRYRRPDCDVEITRQVEVLMGAAMFLPRDVFFTCGPWDEEYTFGGEDIELSTAVGRNFAVVYHPEVEITHYGRVSTRQHIGCASLHIAIGFLRYLRKCGYSRPALLIYKLIVTLDAPVQLVGKGLQYLRKRVKGRRDQADKSLLVVRAHAHFLLKGLVPFWRA